MKVSIGKLAEKLGVSVDTLRNWERKGKLIPERTSGGHRRYDVQKAIAIINKKPTIEKIVIAYARVPTPNKKDDLERQKQVLELYCAAKGYKYKIIEDIGSGLNYNKKGLLELIRLIESNQVSKLILNYKDRLLRFGNEIIFEICKYHDVEVVILNEDEQKTYEEELVEDVLSIITDFSAKIYGSRSHKNKKIVSENEKLFKKE
jgi:predicted site-specific integrase-resolvase